MALGNPVVATVVGVGIGPQSAVPSKLFTYGQTTEVDGVLQNGGWIDLAGTVGFIAEMIQGGTAGNGYMGTYGLQVSNDQTNIYTLWGDNNPTIVQNYKYALINKAGWRYVRPYTKNLAGNTGYFTAQISTYGQERVMDALWEGVQSAIDPVVSLTAGQFTAARPNQQDFQIPYGCAGVEFNINCTALTGTSFTPTFYKKDPTSGLYVSIGTGVVVSGTGLSVVKMSRGLTAAAGVFSDSVSPHMAVTFAVSGFTSAALTITAVPVQ